MLIFYKNEKSTQLPGIFFFFFESGRRKKCESFLDGILISYSKHISSIHSSEIIYEKCIYLLDVLQTFSTITNPDALKNMSIVTKRK